MPRSRYGEIYRDLKDKIETNVYPFQSFLPPELKLVKEYSCSRNTIRRAVSLLVSDGYVQTMQGKGVRCIYHPSKKHHIPIFAGDLETFREGALRRNIKYNEKVMEFYEFEADEEFSQKSDFPVGTELFYVQKLHFLNDEPSVINHSYLLKAAMPDLTKEIAENSIYIYLEEELMMNIVNGKRTCTIEKVTPLDVELLKIDTKEYNCLPVFANQTFNSDGIMFEYNITRHRPDLFFFTSTAVRRTNLK